MRERGEGGERRPGFSVRVKTALRRWSLDGQLAAGTDPVSSPLLSHRAAQLTCPAERERLAHSLRSLMGAPRKQRQRSAAISPDFEEVARARRLLVIVEALLGSEEPVYAQGMAMLRRMLSDTASPLYSPEHPGALSDEAELIVAALRGRPAR